MGRFVESFEHIIENEGGYQLTNIKNDKGGMTYAGISRRYHPSWAGWNFIDNNDMDNSKITGLVKSFYKKNFWDRLSCDYIKDSIAHTIFDFGINVGVKVSAKLAQIAAGVTPDGIIGPKSISALNASDKESFVLKFTLAKITRYANICNKDKTQKKFLLGWINRSIKGLT